MLSGVGRGPVTPMHRGDPPRGKLRAIIKQTGLNVGDFLDLLESAALLANTRQT